MIDIEIQGRLAIVRLRHGKVNAFDVELLDAFVVHLERLAARDEVGAIILTGNGRVFSAGVDLSRVVDGGAAYVAKLMPALSSAFRSLFAIPKPVVAAIDGAAVAGGFVLACACDVRIMVAGTARIGASELAVGVPFPAAALEVFRFAVGDRAERLAMSAALLSSDEALTMGIVDAVVPPEALLGRATTAAEQLASIPAPAFRLVKEQLRRPTIERIDRDAPALDPDVELVWVSADTARNLAAQLERLRAR